MSVTKKTLIGHVDCTPSWEETVRSCLAIITGSTKPEAIKWAEGELYRCGRLADAYIKLTADEQKRIASAYKGEVS